MDSTVFIDDLVTLQSMRFLMVGEATRVADALARALDGEGATVRRVASLDEALTDLADGEHDVVLAHYSSTPEANASLVDQVHRLGDPESAPALAAFCEAGECDEAIDEGFDGVVTTPFERGPLLSSIRDAVERAGLRRRQVQPSDEEFVATVRSRAGARATSVQPTGTLRVVSSRFRSTSATDGESEIALDRGGNLLLEALSDEAFERLAAHMSPIRLFANTVLVEAGEPARFLYFLGEGVASRIVRFAKRASADVGLIGREGVVDLDALLGRDCSPFTTIMRVDGKGWRVPIDAGLEAFREERELHDAVLRYAAVRETEATMTSVCNRVHSAESRLARWLLVVRAETGTDRFPLTQEILASIVGLRRAGVTVAARALKTAGIIDYSWGQIRITDVSALESKACECHHLLKAWFDR